MLLKCFRRVHSRAPNNSSSFSRMYGQPTASTHPHLVRQLELTPGIPLEEYKTRRQALLHRLPTSSVAVISSASVKYVSKGIFYKYRQSSDFFYLTGMLEPGAVLVLGNLRLSPSDHAVFMYMTEKNGPKARSTLFMRGTSPVQELWEGPRTGVDAAPEMFAVDEARSIETLPAHLASLLPLFSHVYIDIPKRVPPHSRSLQQNVSDAALFNFDDALNKVSLSKVRPLYKEVNHLRKFKSAAEIGLMRRAADISANAHAMVHHAPRLGVRVDDLMTQTMRFTEPGVSEGVLASHFEYLCVFKGSERPAYVPVVASGSNALVVHYTANNQLLKKNELILMDAGCELHGYASDLTRTWPVSGTFTNAQRDLYQAVLNTLHTITSLASENRGHTLETLHYKSTEVLLQELKQVGLDITKRVLGVLYPHFIGHPLGLDVHESWEAHQHERLKESMVIAIEPGVYVPEDSCLPKHFHNMGIRIEDEILVHKEHAEVLSTSAPKEVVDVEGACQGALGLGPYWG